MAQSGIAPGQRDAEARPEIFREIGVVSGREEQPPLCAISPGGETERALGRDMDRFGREVVQPLCEPVPNTDREPDPPVRWGNVSNPYPGSSMASAAFVSTRGGNLDGMSGALSFPPAG